MKNNTFLSVPELSTLCTEECEEVHLDCLSQCENDLIYISECTRQMAYCIQGKSILNIMTTPVITIHRCISDCPCNAGCPDGCEGCDNLICQCQVKLYIANI